MKPRDLRLLRYGEASREFAVLESAALPRQPVPSDFGLIGRSQAFLDMWEELLDAAADPDAAVLLLGPKGAGKTEVSKALHKLSGRGGRSEKLSLTGLTGDNGLNQLLGVAARSGTGAREMRGVVAKARGGTVFLDELNALKDLNVAEVVKAMLDGERLPVRFGDDRIDCSGVRFVVASNRPLRVLVDEGFIPHDLEGRFVHRVRVPGLDSRREDIPLLLGLFLETLQGKRPAGQRARVLDGVLEVAADWTFPAHVRDLRNVANHLDGVVRRRVRTEGAPGWIDKADVTTALERFAEPPPGGGSGPEAGDVFRLFDIVEAMDVAPGAAATVVSLPQEEAKKQEGLVWGWVQELKRQGLTVKTLYGLYGDLKTELEGLPTKTPSRVQERWMELGVERQAVVLAVLGRRQATMWRFAVGCLEHAMGAEPRSVSTDSEVCPGGEPSASILGEDFLRSHPVALSRHERHIRVAAIQTSLIARMVSHIETRVRAVNASLPADAERLVALHVFADVVATAKAFRNSGSPEARRRFVLKNFQDALRAVGRPLPSDDPDRLAEFISRGRLGPVVVVWYGLHHADELDDADRRDYRRYFNTIFHALEASGECVFISVRPTFPHRRKDYLPGRSRREQDEGWYTPADAADYARWWADSDDTESDAADILTSLNPHCCAPLLHTLAGGGEVDGESPCATQLEQAGILVRAADGTWRSSNPDFLLHWADQTALQETE